MDLKVVGKSLTRLDTPDKAVGKTIYIDDMVLPHMLHGMILRSPLPHAKIINIDTSQAKKLAGVKAVVTGADIPDGRHGPFIKDQPALAKGKVRHIGEPIAALAATTRELAEEAVEMIKVDYQELPVVLDPVKALEPDAALVHEDYENYLVVFPGAIRKGNLVSQTIFKEGDLELGLKESDLVLEDSFSTQSAHQTYMEPCGAIASFDAQGRVTVWTNSQAPHLTQIRIFEALLIPMAGIRVTGLKLGGGFGGKVEPHVQLLAVALAKVSDKPVKIIQSREEELADTRPRHPAQINITTGVKKDGTLWARKTKLIYDCGAYADDGPGICGFGAMMSRGPYLIPHVHIEGSLVYTNKVGFGAYRGFGNPQTTFAFESHLDMIADKLGIDPVELRLKNTVANGDVQLGGETMASVGIEECIKKASTSAKWKRANGSSNRGMGIACLQHISGVLSSSAVVKIMEDGSACVQTGAAELGAGQETVLSQIAAEELGLPLEDIRIIMADTDATPYNWGTQGSRATYCAGNAIKAAAADAKAHLFKIAATQLEANPEDLLARERRVFVKGSPEKGISFRELGILSHWVTGGPAVGSSTFMVEARHTDPKRVIGFPFGGVTAFIFAAQVVEVEVDRDTGQVKILQAHAAHDVGKAINPLNVEGQIQGGFVQGVGYALAEQLTFDNGKIINANLMDYKIPAATDVPNIVTVIVEEPEPTGPFGAKGVGEPGLVATAPALANAVYDAIGVRIKDLPITSEKILNALKYKQV
ncbi:MAG: xanthine dehydrogenase family protein molybdopterin-binding subunit [Dehalococcoidales bacterium]